MRLRGEQFATRDPLILALRAKNQYEVSRVRSRHMSRPFWNVNLLELPYEIIEFIIQSTADGLALLPYRLVSRLFNDVVLRHAFADFCPRTQNKFRALVQVCQRPRHLGGPPRIRRLAFPSDSRAIGITSAEVIELLDLTTRLRSLATSWLFDLETLEIIPRAFAELKHLCVYMQCSMRQVAWCMQLHQLQSLAVTEVKVEEDNGIVEWMKEHRSTSSIVKMRIGLQGNVLTDGFCHLLLTPRSLEGLTVFAASNVIVQLLSSADTLLQQHQSTLSALSFYCLNLKPWSAPTPTVESSTGWFTQFPLLRQLCLCTSHIGALQGFYTTPNFLRAMIHSPLELFVLKGLWPPEPHGQLYWCVLDLIQTRNISSLTLWTPSPLHSDDVTGLLEACRKNGIELTFWSCKDQYSCIA